MFGTLASAQYAHQQPRIRAPSCLLKSDSLTASSDTDHKGKNREIRPHYSAERGFALKASQVFKSQKCPSLAFGLEP